jgi:ferredoxin
MNEIALPLRGGCLCGACRWELRGSAFELEYAGAADAYISLQDEVQKN